MVGSGASVGAAVATGAALVGTAGASVDGAGVSGATVTTGASVGACDDDRGMRKQVSCWPV